MSVRVRRVQLYMPGDDQRKIEKGTTLGVDSLVLDIEDGVALGRKEVARQMIAESLRTLDFGRSERVVRINAVGTGFEADDLNVILPARPDAILIPKVERAEQVQWVSARLDQEEQLQGWAAGSIRLLVLIETAMGIVNLREIAASDSRLEALIFGAYDMASSLGATASKDGSEVSYARSAVVTYAAAFGLQAIDSVYIELQDIEGLIVAASRAAHMGYVGKQAIHPRQIEPIAEAFSPTDSAIAEAQTLIEAYEAHQRDGRGVFALDGKMVDTPILRGAENVIARARAAGKVK